MINSEICVNPAIFYSNNAKLLLGKFLVYFNMKFVEWNSGSYWTKYWLWRMIQWCLSFDDLMVRRTLMRALILLQEPFPFPMPINSSTADGIMWGQVTGDSSQTWIYMACELGGLGFDPCHLGQCLFLWRLQMEPCYRGLHTIRECILPNINLSPILGVGSTIIWKVQKAPGKREKNSQIGLCGFQMNVCADSKHRQRWCEQKWV